MKPEAPAELRGEFKPVSTAVPGIQICEHLPLLAARMRHWAIVRSLSHGENGHLPASHKLMTGAPMPNQRDTDLDNVLSRRDWPCYAAGLKHVRPRHDGVPSGVTLPNALIEGPLTWPGQHAGFLGAGHDPLLVTQDPSSPDFRMEAFGLPPGTDANRLDQRRRLLDQLAMKTGGTGPMGTHQQLAFEMLASGKVAEAFRLEREPDRVRDRYGRHLFGQSLLLSRRLIQAGVPIVQANMGIVQTWDTHGDNWGSSRRPGYPRSIWGWPLSSTISRRRDGWTTRWWPCWGSLVGLRKSALFLAIRWRDAIIGLRSTPACSLAAASRAAG